MHWLPGLWVAAATWILASPETQSLLASIRMHLPAAVKPFTSPTVRWSLLAVIWALAVYDAAAERARGMSPGSSEGHGAREAHGERAAEEDRPR